jgi:hypothetical protein
MFMFEFLENNVILIFFYLSPFRPGPSIKNAGKLTESDNQKMAIPPKIRILQLGFPELAG